MIVHYFHELGIPEHDEVIKDARWLPLFERIFSWGVTSSLNDVDLEHKRSVDGSHHYCRNHKSMSKSSPPSEDNA